MNGTVHHKGIFGMGSFDRVDAAILRALQADGTLSQSRLAEMVGASAASCWRRVRALEERGILGPTVRLVDADALGLSVNALCYVRLKNHLPETSRAFESFLETAPSIVECYAVSGDWDYLMRVVAADIASYERVLRTEILANAAVATASSNFALSTRKRTTALPVPV